MSFPLSENSVSWNYQQKVWEELICLLPLHKLTVNNIQRHHLHTKCHPNPPVGSKVIKRFLCKQLRSLNFRHFGIAEATRLKMWHRGHLQRHYLPTKFHENQLISSKVISGGHTGPHTHTHTHTHTHRLVIWWAYFLFWKVAKMVSQLL
jgi:hypothetical protein